MKTTFEAVIHSHGGHQVIIVHNGLERKTPLFRPGESMSVVASFVETALEALTGEPAHWYVAAFGVKTILQWIETEVRRNARIDVDIKRTLKLEVG